MSQLKISAKYTVYMYSFFILLDKVLFIYLFYCRIYCIVFWSFCFFPQEIAVETNCNHKNIVRLWWFIMAFYNVLCKVICYRDSCWLPVNFNIKQKHIKCIFPTNVSYLQDRKKKIHSCWKCQHSTCWWKIYFILNILQYWMIKREKNGGIEFCIMSVQHTGNKINKESKPKL